MERNYVTVTLRNMRRKFGKVRTYGRWHIGIPRQTNRHAHHFPIPGQSEKSAIKIRPLLTSRVGSDGRIKTWRIEQQDRSSSVDFVSQRFQSNHVYWYNVPNISFQIFIFASSYSTAGSLHGDAVISDSGRVLGTHRLKRSYEQSQSDTAFTHCSRSYNRLYEHSRLYNRLGELCKWAQPSGAWAVQPGRLWRH